MHKRNTNLEVMQKVMAAKCIRLTHKIVKTPSDRNLYYLLFLFLMASFGNSENAFTIQEFEQNIVLLQPIFMSGEFSIFDLNNQLPHSSDWLIC
jgi:hypothetical protein